MPKEPTGQSASPGEPPASGPPIPPGFQRVYEGQPLPPFYAAEMLRPLLGKYVWVKDDGDRVRTGQLKKVPAVRNEDAREAPPVEFEDERPLFLRQIVCIAVYVPWSDSPQTQKKGR